LGDYYFATTQNNTGIMPTNVAADLTNYFADADEILLQRNITCNNKASEKLRSSRGFFGGN
jgi:hypothetical protein